MLSDNELHDLLHDRFYYKDGKFFYRKPCGSASKNAEAGTLHPKYKGVTIKIHRVSYQRDRLVWLYHHGKLPYRNLKHVDGRNWNDRIDNLYECTRFIQEGQEPKTRMNT